jgi:hypothetical protein
MCPKHRVELFKNLIKKYMYVFKRRQVTMQQGIATVLAIALVLWAVGAHMFTNVAEASNLTYVKDTLSDSAPSSVSDHTFQFLSPTGLSAGQAITITFPNGFNIGTSSVNFSDVDLAIAGVDQTLAATPAGATWGVSTTSQNLIITSGSGTIAPNATITVEVGLNAAFGVAGDAQVTNPTATTSYEFTITVGSADSGQTRVAIINNVLVTANVDTTLTFTVYGTPSGTTVNTSPTTTSTTTSSTALPFGTLSPNVSKTLAQDLTVATNAIHGYVVTVMQDQQLLSSTGADIDGFVDGNWTTTPTAWAAPSNNISNENTWGHWGLTSDDATAGRAIEFGANQWVAASTTPVIIMAHTGPADGTTDEIGTARIGYQVQITALQEAGDDYNTTLTYVATPTF